MSARDPRVDPRCGDVLLVGRSVQTIDFVNGLAVWMRRTDDHVGWLPLDDFQVWARDAVVLAEGVP